MTNRDKLKEECEENLIELSYTHENEITLAMDDIWFFIDSKLKEAYNKGREDAIKEIKDVPRFVIKYKDGSKSKIILEHSLETHGLSKPKAHSLKEEKHDK